MDSDEMTPVGSMRYGPRGECAIDFAVTPDGRVHFTVGDGQGKFIGVALNERQEEEFAQHYVATCFTARRERERLRRAGGASLVEVLARDLARVREGL